MISKPRIMVVEDTYIVAKDIQDTLSELGYLVSEIASSGKEAMEVAGQNKPDLVLMDIKLSGNMDGIETASQLQERYDVPVIYLTAYADNHILERAKRTQPCGYIIKPYKKMELHSTIEMALYKSKMENFLKSREELMSTTLRSISNAVITVDVKGNLTFLNPVAEKLFGLSLGSSYGKSINDVYMVLEDKTNEVLENPVFKVLEAGDTVELENHLLQTNDNRKIQAFQSISPIQNEMGEILGGVVIIRDITEQKLLQEELLKAQKLESLTSLAGGIAHKFNNLLTVIIGNTNLLKVNMKTTDTSLKAFSEMEEAVTKAKDLTSQLLSFSEGNKLTIKTVSPFDLMKKTIESFFISPLIDFQYRIANDLWFVDIDDIQISRVFFNLIKNIYLTRNERIKITIDMVNFVPDERILLPLKNERYVKISIKSSDPSVSKDSLNGLLDPYFSSKSYETSLELAATYATIKNHNGYVAINSSAGEGTGVDIYLPASQKKAPPTGGTKKRKQELQKRILVMDDQELVRIIAGKMLNHFGYEVEFARHGKEALDLYKKALENEKYFDCVILDLTIEVGMGGKETLKKLLELDPDVKAIVSSGYSNDPIIYDYKSHGFKGVIIKPYELSDLNRILHNIINSD
ncbi:MAG: response regulator [Spirochaetales bacterium]|nr:response regulator [Spirochaetales bacterium]